MGDWTHLLNRLLQAQVSRVRRAIRRDTLRAVVFLGGFVVALVSVGFLLAAVYSYLVLVQAMSPPAAATIIGLGLLVIAASLILGALRAGRTSRRREPVRDQAAFRQPESLNAAAEEVGVEMGRFISEKTGTALITAFVAGLVAGIKPPRRR